MTYQKNIHSKMQQYAKAAQNTPTPEADQEWSQENLNDTSNNSSLASDASDEGAQEAAFCAESANLFEEEQNCPNCLAVKAEAEDTRLRSLAEMENFKKRLGREWEEKSKYISEAILADLLPAIDSLDLAIMYGSKDEACQDLLKGVSMTHKMLMDALKKHGLTSLGEVGQAFDPELHEAVAQEICEDMEPGHICKLMQRGYQLHTRLLRPAKVCVSTK